MFSKEMTGIFKARQEQAGASVFEGGGQVLLKARQAQAGAGIF